MTDHIRVGITGSEKLLAIAERGRDEIAGAVLADAFDCTDGIAKDWNINGEDVTITVAKI